MVFLASAVLGCVGLSISLISCSNSKAKESEPAALPATQEKQVSEQEAVFNQWASDIVKGGDGSQFFCDDLSLKYAQFYSPRKVEILNVANSENGETKIKFRLESSNKDGTPIIKNWGTIIASNDKGRCIDGIVNEEGQYPRKSDAALNWFDKKRLQE
jgi:hypothetical protein